MEKNLKKDSVKIEIEGSHGYVSTANGTVMTFEMCGVSEREDLINKEFRSIYSQYATDRMTIRLGDIQVPMWGEGHNLYPQEVYSVISENKLLPEVIEKQIRFLFGKGPRIFKEEVKEGLRVRTPIEDKVIQAWLDSWEDKGFPHYWEYLKNLISDYYHVKTCVTKYNFNKGRRLGTKGSIDALTYIGADMARLGAIGDFTRHKIALNDCQYVLVGDWLNISLMDYSVYPRFQPNNPTKYPTAIAFNGDKTFSKWVYAYNDWFKGLYDWIKASNLSPRYLNSYFKNALNAHMHVSIPAAWIQQQVSAIQNVINENLQNTEGKYTAEYQGVRLVDAAGKPYAYQQAMIDDRVKYELKKVTDLMTGEGKNQGKIFPSVAFGEEAWKFEEMPGKFKEYMEAVITVDKRADAVILAGKGISSSITNVTDDGRISASGSEAYYDYLIYISSLTLDEYFVCKEINRALHLNFPYAKLQGYKIGFWIDIPAKQQDTTPKDRLINTATAEPIKK